jgi:hypothetical protein
VSLEYDKPSKIEKVKYWPKETLIRKRKSHLSDCCVKNSWELNTANPRLGDSASGEKFHRCNSQSHRGILISTGTDSNQGHHLL